MKMTRMYFGKNGIIEASAAIQPLTLTLLPEDQAIVYATRLDRMMATVALI
jgi:hypothetical protein